MCQLINLDGTISSAPIMTSNAKAFCIATVSVITMFSCEDAPPIDTPTGSEPEVATLNVNGIVAETVVAWGEVLSDGNDDVTARGFCWSTNPNPTIAGDVMTNGAGLGVYNGTLSGLSPNTTYYVRAYATNGIGTSYGADFEVTTLDTGIALGSVHQGGIIFYLDGSGEHGLIAAPVDQGDYLWGCEGTSVPGTSTALGTGQSNTTAIVNACSAPDIAARICDDLELNGFDDWYLPSKDELNLLHQNLYLEQIGNFVTFRYWSSSQFNQDFAWCQLFNLNLNQLYYDKDLIPNRTRAIRNF